MVVALALVGLFFSLSGAVGVLRMPDLYTRVQASSKAITLYARGVADAILEGRSQAINEVVQQMAGDDEFVEVDDEAED